MVIVTVVPQYPRDLGELEQVVPLDAGRWAVLTEGTPAERRRVARDLRLLSHRRPALRLAA